MRGKVPISGGKALEIRMRDAMDGMFDSATYFAYSSHPDTVQILSIEPPKPVTFDSASTAEVVSVKSTKRVSDFLPARELHLERLPN